MLDLGADGVGIGGFQAFERVICHDSFFFFFFLAVVCGQFDVGLNPGPRGESPNH